MLSHGIDPPSLPFSLPNELLSEIFQTACLTSNARSTTLKAISHVCHLWRHVALGYSELWIQADYEHDHPEWVSAQLHRAANMPVVVQAHFPMAARSTRGLRNLRLALKDATIRALDLQASPEILDQVWTDLDAASLRTLSLFIPWPDMPKIAPYPGPVFQLNTPHLRHLSLSNFVVSWDSSLFTKLTHLRLHLQDQAFAPSMTQILGMLSSSPMLAELILLHVIESSSRLPHPDSVSVVPLPHVAALLLDSDLLNHIFLLRHIDVPPHCSLSLKAEHRTEKIGLITELGHSISQSLSLAQVEKVCVETDPSGFTVRGYAAACPANPRIHIALRYSEMDLAVAGTLLCSLPLIATAVLELSFRGPHSAATHVETWRMFFQNLGTVEVLQVKPTTPRNLLSALAACEGRSLLLPRLQSLEIHDPDVVDPTSSPEINRKKPRQLGNWWQRAQVANITFFDSLLTCVKSRQKLDAEIGSLRLGRCPHFSGQQLDSLKVAVKDVSWC
ncbi:hypothetical protein B0H17DRAFT_1209967 [Mycena rosella]|uniref:F-box domain-containing protein n=1 Tax=Mycena rosella TaxID=1033263 RepID=A0AAD7CXS8_MYCRO|nr:hypothetical protein B0H17DRAFT_1209967 [Mycena rosella]